MVHTLDKWLFLDYFQTLLCLTFEVQYNLYFTCDNQKSERAYWFHRNSMSTGKAHLLEQIMLFLKALMVLPLMDVTINASNNFYGIVYQMWFHWIYCFYPWKNTFPSKKHLGLIDILQLSESPVIFLSFITPETCPVAVTLDSTQISLNPAPWKLTRMGNDLQLHWGL